MRLISQSIAKQNVRLLFFILLLPGIAQAGLKTWTGYGGDNYWSNPLNWSDIQVPQNSDEVLLDNQDMPISYQVVLPDVAVVIKSLSVRPSPGRTIEVVLPVSNKLTNAFTVTGPGYGLELNAGAIFRNASGISAGESIHISDSLIIYDGGRYIHQTRGAHANQILDLLSKAPGTEQGVFDFDVPRASYTISASNRIYGSLELHSTAFGAAVNYTCSGSNLLKIRGNFRIGQNVTMSMDFATSNGNVQILGDFIQEGGILNLSSGTGDNTIFKIQGDVYQSPASIITETSNGVPFIEIGGNRLQEVAFGGQIQNQVGFRINNTAGMILRLPLTLPYTLDLKQGIVFTSGPTLLSLSDSSTIIVDSTASSSYIDGPLFKTCKNMLDHFLFPVGKQSRMHWLELKNINGEYLVEYIRNDPDILSPLLGSGLDHISSVEYWNVTAEHGSNSQVGVELSFSASESGGVTDPGFLNVASLESGYWQNAGHLYSTGNFVRGSVLSPNIIFANTSFTLASTIKTGNPLPLTTIELHITERSGKTVFDWQVESVDKAHHFELYDETNGLHSLLCLMKAVDDQTNYRWVYDGSFDNGDHYFKINMTDVNNNIYEGKKFLFRKTSAEEKLFSLILGDNTDHIIFQSSVKGNWDYEIINLNGQCISRGTLNIHQGKNDLGPVQKWFQRGIYIFKIWKASGKAYTLTFRKG